MSEIKILIAGGGIAGPALAYWLTRIPTESPLSIIILERSPVPRITGQSVDIRGPAVKVMQSMNLEAAVRAAGTPEKGMQKLNPQGQVLMTLDSTGDPNQQTFTSEFEILRGDLARVLLAAVEHRPGVQCVFGDYISSVHEAPQTGKLHVEFTNGQLPAGEYDVVIGADGVMSRLRPLITGRPAKEDIRSFNAYGAVYTVPRAAFDSPTHAAVMHYPRSRWAMIRPSSSGTGVYLTIGPGRPNDALERALEQSPAEQKKALSEAYADRPGAERAGTARLIEGMYAAPDFYYQNIVQVVAPRWTKGRMAVLGDAASCPSAFSGMGTSAALYGAYVLAGELGGAVGEGGDGDVAGALERYERKARPYLMSLQNVSERGWRLFCPETAWGVWMLDLAFWVLGVLNPMRIVMWLAKHFPQKEEIEPLPEYTWAPA